MNFPPNPPEWVSQWPQKHIWTSLYKNHVRALFARMKGQLRPTGVKWHEKGMAATVDRHTVRWILKKEGWAHQCTCGLPGSLCVHTYSLGLAVDDFFTAQGLSANAPAGTSTIRKTSGISAAPKPAANQPITRPSKPKLQAREWTLTVEVDLKTTPEHALLRFYQQENNGKRDMLPMRRVHSFSLACYHRSRQPGHWDYRDEEFLGWLYPLLPINEIKAHELTALKITKGKFNQWLQHWVTLQPARFIDRFSQTPIHTGSNRCILHFDLTPGEDDRTKICAIVTLPDGKTQPYHYVARQITKYKNQPEDQAKAEFVLDGRLYSLKYPISRRIYNEIFSTKQPSIPTAALSEHLPSILEFRLDLIHGDLCRTIRNQTETLYKIEVKKQTFMVTAQPADGSPIGHPSLEVNAEGYHIKLPAALDLTPLEQLAGKFPQGRLEGSTFTLAIDPTVFSELPLWHEQLSDDFATELSEAADRLLKPQVGTPQTRITPQGSWLEIDMHWQIGDQKVSREAMADALSHDRDLVRSADGELVRVDVQEMSKLSAYLQSEGLFFNNQRVVATGQALGMLQALKEKHPEYLEKRSTNTLNTLLENLPDDYELNADLAPILRHYQHDGFTFLKELDRYRIGSLLADDMGLGKTLQVLSFLSSRPRSKQPALVCAPASVLGVWKNEAKRFTPQLKTMIYHGAIDQREKLRKQFTEFDLIISSYGTVRNDSNHLIETCFNCIVLDEAQSIRNPKAQVTEAICTLRADQRVALTGTPIENTLTDLWSISQFLNPGLLGPLKKFRQQFEGNTPAHMERRVELARRIRPLLLRRTKEAVATELPPKSIEHLTIPLSSCQEQLYKKQFEALREELTNSPENIEKPSMHILSLLTRLRQICGHPALIDEAHKEITSAKLEALKEMLETITAEGHSALIFSSFTSLLDEAETMLKPLNLPHFTITGKTPVPERAKLVDRFSANEDPALFFLSLKAAGTGLTLTKADYVFILDPWWNPAAEAQAIDRTHRIGQDKPVFAYKLIAADTIEEQILALQQEKQELFDEMLAESNAVPQKITTALLQALLQPEM